MQDESKKYSELELLDLEKLSRLIPSSQLPKALRHSLISTPAIPSSTSWVKGFLSSPKPPSSSTDLYTSSEYIIRPLSLMRNTSG